MVIDISKRDFADNQIIIASIFQRDIDNINIIEIDDRLINGFSINLIQFEL